jgi:molecular chaperone DnaK (HSP70)
MRLGIDFGTTHTVVAMSDHGNHPTVSFLDAQQDLHDFFPSVVAFEGDTVRYGLEALEVARKGARLERSFKRWLGGTHASPTQRVPGAPQLTMLDLVSGFLEALHKALVSRSTVGKLHANEPFQVAVAVPANAHSAQRFITLEAFRRAGFEVTMMMNEPSAAGIEYAHHDANAITSRRDLVLVYDLGGGTFDASLVSMEGGKHEVMASSGISRLGGDDFDEILLEFALRELSITRNSLSPNSRTRLLAHCCEVKESINPNTKRLFVDVRSCLDAGELTEARLPPEGVVLVAADEYEAACMRVVSRTVGEVERVIQGHESELAAVYVVGGASSLPVVTRVLRQRFGNRVKRSRQPSSSAAIGLSIAADPASGVGVKERLNRCFGVFREADSGGGVSFDVILDATVQVPGDFAKPHSIRRRYQPVHNIGHFRFIECSSLTTDKAPSGDITHVAQVVFPFAVSLQQKPVLDLTPIPITRVSSGEHWIEEVYEVDAAGIITLVMTDLQTGYKQTHLFK